MGRPKGSRSSAAANMTAAGSRLPRRYKKNGKEVGNYFQRVGVRDVNLRTTNAELALKRASEAKAGTTRWIQDDGDTETATAAPEIAGTGAAKTVPVVESPAPAASGFQAGGAPVAGPPPQPTYPTHTAPAALPPMTPPPAGETPPQRESVRPDAYFSPTTGWADAVRAAAGGAPGGEGGGDEDDEGLDPEFLDGLIDQAAALAVDLQLMFHAWVLKKRAELHAGEVPESGPKSKARTIGAKIWARELRKAMPTDLGIPGWIAAPLMVAAYGLPVQIGDATPIKPDATAPGSAPSSTPAAAETTTGETI